MTGLLRDPVDLLAQRQLRAQWRRRGREFLKSLEPLVASPHIAPIAAAMANGL